MMDINIVGNSTAAHTAVFGSNGAAPNPSTIEPLQASESAVFERLMSDLVPKKLPENRAVSTLLQQQNDFNQHINAALPPSVAQISDAQKMMVAQLNIMQAVVLVGFTAKMAGSLSQSINRLVNIQ